MCYSAQIENDYRRYMRVVGPENALSIQDFINKYWERQESLPSMKIPKAVDAWFADPKTEDERKIAAMIRDYDARQIAKFEQEIFKQRSGSPTPSALSRRRQQRRRQMTNASPRTKLTRR